MSLIGIIGAMDEEVAELKQLMTEVNVTTVAGMDFFRGTFEGKPAVVVQSGVGKVNAAICTQILVDHFQVDVVINSGIAGSLQNKIDIGDIVLSSDAVQHDMDATVWGYAPGQVPGMETYIFPGDEKLISLAEEVCAEVNPEIHTFRGRIVSGDQFIADKDTKEKLISTFDGYCAEMEGAAIAQTAWRNKVPFLIIRVICDKADGSAVADDNTFTADCVKHCVRLLQGMAKKI
uniref:adenosylhomocysteine nucleosidase n=1 Tax=Eubacterium cellulosolvens (strain ATCC 43171 / JCM 9499 / 6) TaxID=633697 RepID=I5ATR2_EUBC6